MAKRTVPLLAKRTVPLLAKVTVPLMANRTVQQLAKRTLSSTLSISLVNKQRIDEFVFSVDYIYGSI